MCGGEWSFAGGCVFWRWVFLWFGLGGCLCVTYAAITWCAKGTSGGVGKVMYEVGDVLVQFPGEYVVEMGSGE